MSIVKRKILSLEVDSGKYSDFIVKIISLAANKKSSYVCVSNVHMTIEAYDDKAFANCVNGADLVTPDGMPLVKAMKLLYGIKSERVAGMDLMPSILEIAEKEQISIFFYGGTQSMLDKTAVYLKNNYPDIKAVSFFSPPFRALEENEKIEIVNRINESQASIVFVVLGCPKQERWMAENKGKINACMIGVGGALPVIIGEQKRAPMWMQRASLEWFYRFCQEPRRLFKRYFYTNTKFLLLLFIALIKKAFGKA